MGYPMCMNIHAKIDANDHLFICDINESALEKFVQEQPGQAKTTILKTPRDICEHCVRILSELHGFLMTCKSHCRCRMS